MSTITRDRQVALLGAPLAELAEAPGWALTDEQVTAGIVAVAKARASADELLTRLTQLAEERSLAQLAGATSTTAWVANLTGLSKPQASKFIRWAKALSEQTEATRVAWAGGSITSEQAGVIAEAIGDLPDTVSVEECAAAETFLLDKAGVFALDDLKRLANHVLEVIDPVGAEAYVEQKLREEEQRAYARTSLELFSAGNGMTKGRFLLPNAQAGMLTTVLEGLASPRRGEPRIYDRDGEHSDAASGALTHPQRLGRALCELIEHLPTDAFPQHGGLAATLTVTIDVDKLKHQLGSATLSTGDELSASQARRLACNAGILPAVLDSTSKVLDLGGSRRLFNDHQRIALGLTQKGCCWKGCDRPPAWCEAHHVHWFSHGGKTDLDNGALFCFYHHHHLLHNGEWACRIADDGTPEVIPPARIDPRQRPLRHTRFIPRN